MRVLVVGGTGPTGPHVVRGLRDRGHDVTIFHRGAHELPELAEVEHLHGDPHFRGPIEEALGSRTFDLVIAMYGRARHLAAALAGRCAHFVCIGGVPVYRGYFPGTGDLPIPVTEGHPVVREDSGDPAARFSRKLADAERAMFACHPGATIFRFPMLYGPNNPRPHEWWVVRRVRDGRIPGRGPPGHLRRRPATRTAGAQHAAPQEPGRRGPPWTLTAARTARSPWSPAAPAGSAGRRCSVSCTPAPAWSSVT